MRNNYETGDFIHSPVFHPVSATYWRLSYYPFCSLKKEEGAE